MRCGWLRVELHIPHAQSLKEKRRPLKSLLEKIRQRFNAAAAEVEHHDLHQRAAIGLAFVAVDGGHLADQMRAVREFIHQNPDCLVLDIRESVFGDDHFSSSLGLL